MSVKAIDKIGFENEVLNGKGVCLVDFWASWCSPCLMLAPTIEELSEEVAGVGFYKVNIDEYPEIAMDYKIMSIPTVMVFENGEVRGKLVGLRDKAEYEQLLG